MFTFLLPLSLLTLLLNAQSAPNAFPYDYQGHPWATPLLSTPKRATFPLGSTITNDYHSHPWANPLLSLPKMASLEQVLVFLNELDRMMEDTQISFRLHKRREAEEGNPNQTAEKAFQLIFFLGPILFLSKGLVDE